MRFQSMSKKSEIKRLWTETFHDPAEWTEMFFDRVYDDSEAMTIEADGQIVSSLLLQHYSMMFHGREMPISYICGALTRRQLRGRGYMSMLMGDVLRASRERGEMLCTLIPAHDWLYFFYDKFGFSTVFYSDIQRFTSLHAFAGIGNYYPVDNLFDSRVYDAMQRMERLREGTVLHSHRHFLNIMDDLRLENAGRFVAMQSAQGEVCSLAWAVKRDEIVEVRELLSVDDQAAQAALRELRSHYPDTPMRLLAPAEKSHRRLSARGMGRIVNAGLTLEAIAAANPGWSNIVRVSDRLLPENSHTYVIAGGEVAIDDSSTMRPGVDVSIETLNRIVFSETQMGEIIGIPSHRAHMSLMLD